MLLGCTVEENVQHTSDSYALGVVLPLTGDVASYGEPELKAIQLAVDEINEAGGIDGVPLEIIAEDAKCSGREAVTATQKLIDVNNVEVIIGGGCSSETLAMAPIINEHKVLTFSSSSTNPQLTTKGGKYFFRNAPSDVETGKELARLAHEMGFTSMALVSEQADFPQGLREVFSQHYNGKIVADESYNPGDTDFRTQLTRIKSAQPDALFINPQSGIPGGLIARQARELGIDVQFFSNETIGGGDAVESGGVDALVGLVFFQAVLDETNPRSQEFIGAYKDRYGERPPYDIYLAGKYDAVNLIADGIRQNGYSGEGVRAYIDAIGMYGGTLGTYTFDKNGDSTVGITPRVIDETGGNVPYGG